MNFKEYWKIEKGESVDSKLTKEELMEIRSFISKMQDKGMPSTKVIAHLQTMNKKLIEKWKAERAYWTESKMVDTKIVGQASKELDINTYKMILSPHACPICISKTDSGKKIFKNSDLKKSGYGHVPPFHPNCYCVMLPID